MLNYISPEAYVQATFLVCITIAFIVTWCNPRSGK